jgi:hypothetical protein
MVFKSVGEHFAFLEHVRKQSIKHYKTKRQYKKFSELHPKTQPLFIKVLMSILVVCTHGDVASLMKYLSDMYAPKIDLSGLFFSYFMVCMFSIQLYSVSSNYTSELVCFYT